ncbi:hypothetical protein MYCTH_42529 [Thermothelomyces thermophilus ATCC 42464]|uniref:Uncharacterized protein n=1 Tax=Thermothelomyces thermophilus (strain ATCC 42464 / BCRC 31852 / DSM 1799) TaxID=573729 RepID=G2Q5X0_THET4|nr:uncharacterized protein MYCTH_42529 [Thermothelomyces thermophilus ATCC 42464]AEO53846.1 hypothetical protein MYCTH_42529 [Thermothelomyces thermophilus ATCC 42464]
MAMDARLAEEEMPVIWTNKVWDGDPGGDVALHFEGRSWMVKKDIVTAHFPGIKASIARTEPVSAAGNSPSFFSYVKMYFLAERFGIDRLRRGMTAGVESLSQHVAALAAHHCPHCRLSRAEVDSEEKRHLASFLDAVRLVEAQPWSARIVKAMYDAGDRMKANLARLPAFREFVEKFPEGRNFARAIGAHRL